MAYIIAFEPKAKQDIAELKKSGNKAVIETWSNKSIPNETSDGAKDVLPHRML